MKTTITVAHEAGVAPVGCVITMNGKSYLVLETGYKQMTVRRYRWFHALWDWLTQTSHGR